MAQVNACEIVRRYNDVDNIVSVFTVDGVTADATDRDIVVAIFDAIDGETIAPVAFNGGGWYNVAAFDGGSLYCYTVDDAAMAGARHIGTAAVVAYELAGGTDEWNELFPDYQI